MMRRLILAAVLALAPSIASAQFATIGPTPPVSDNGDRLATTAWVNSLIANGLTLASGKIWIGSAGNIATPQTPSGDCTLSLSGVVTCTQAAGNFQVIGNLTVGGSIIDGSGILATNIAAPATPAAGTTRIYVDSTQKVLTFKNDAGTVGNAVVPSTAVANQFMTGISAAGVITRAQPAFTDLSGQGSCAQEPAMTGDVTSSAGSCALAIGANRVTRAMEAQGVARSVVGVAGNATANVADIQGTTANTFLGVNSGGTGLAFSTIPNAGLANSATTVAGQTCTLGSTCGLSSLTNSIGANVTMNVSANYFDGPSTAQGTTGTWFASGTVTFADTAVANAVFYCKLWDGTTVIASAGTVATGTSNPGSISLSGVLATPAANIRISCRDTSGTTGLMLFNTSGNSKDSTVTVMRIQ